ncbi:MAG: hypothetical protein D4S01_05095 [Dehalococcoidia bacterium]|nr:MAG: hypothetical protein D4S01_05095 [Dehalococcoidia bacterium]
MTALKQNLTTRITNNEWSDNGLDFCTVELDAKRIKRILHLSKLVEKEKMYSISEFDYTLDFYYGDMEDEEDTWKDVRASNVLIQITKEKIYWEGNIKHSSDMFETDVINIEELKERLKVADAKMVELPLLLNSLKTESAKEALKDRLNLKEEVE